MNLPPLPERWTGTLTPENGIFVADLMDAILRRRCTVVTVTRDIDWISVETSQDQPLENGRAVVLDKRGGIRWQTPGYFWSFGNDNKSLRISWDGACLKINLNAPAGHPLVWIFAPEAPPEVRESDHTAAAERALESIEALEAAARGGAS